MNRNTLVSSRLQDKAWTGNHVKTWTGNYVKTWTGNYVKVSQIQKENRKKPYPFSGNGFSQCAIIRTEFLLLLLFENVILICIAIPNSKEKGSGCICTVDDIFHAMI